MADTTYVVTAPCAVVYNADHSAAATIAKGGAVPRDADPEHVALLVERGMVTEGDPLAGIDHDPDAAPPFPQPEEHTTSRRSARTGDKEE